MFQDGNGYINRVELSLVMMNLGKIYIYYCHLLPKQFSE